MQDFAARVFTDTKNFDHISPILRELGWPCIKDQLLVRDTTQVYKIVNGLAPSYLSSKLSKRSDTHHYKTKKRDNLNLPLCRTVTALRSFYYRDVSTSAWNSLTADLEIARHYVPLRGASNANCGSIPRTLNS